MRYQTGTAFRTALETRLVERAQDSGIAIQRLRRAVAFERLLARLLIVAPNRWMLKGGLALDFRLGARARATKDMDLAHLDDPAAATADLLAAG
ncbi:MAG: nucleotidyl transferase AbiEii/AbiGii toxin family protein, partial [Chloroflexota bacterium]